MKKVFWVFIVLAVLGSFWRAFAIGRQRSLKDFCVGRKKYDFKRVVFEGQDKRAVVTDPASLDYFSNCRKLGPLVVSGGTSFQVSFYDNWGLIGSVGMPVNGESRGIHITYFEHPFAIEDYSSMFIESNAPPRLH